MKQLIVYIVLAASLNACAHSRSYLSPEARNLSSKDIKAHATHCKYLEDMLDEHGHEHTVDSMTLNDFWILNNICSYKLRALLD